MAGKLQDRGDIKDKKIRVSVSVLCTDRGSGDPGSVSWDGEALSPRACPDLILTLMVIGRVTDHRHRLQQKKGRSNVGKY